jgi:hypothetical protein
LITSKFWCFLARGQRPPSISSLAKRAHHSTWSNALSIWERLTIDWSYFAVKKRQKPC